MIEKPPSSAFAGAAPAAEPPPPLRATFARRLNDWSVFVAGLAVIGWAVWNGAQSMGYNWQWYRVPRAFYRVIDGEVIWGPLTKGLLVTLEITLWAAPIALAIGLATALLRLSRSYAGHALATIYLETVRNTPLLVQMYLFYFVLSPILGLDRFWTGVLCLAVFEASFISEILRGGVLSVHRGQWEAAEALGLKRRAVYQRVVLPQALPVMAPPLTSALVNLVKNSAIVSTIAVFDLTNQARNVISDTFLSFEIWFAVAAVYLSITISLSVVAARLEARARRGFARR